MDIVLHKITKLSGSNSNNTQNDIINNDYTFLVKEMIICHHQNLDHLLVILVLVIHSISNLNQVIQQI